MNPFDLKSDEIQRKYYKKKKLTYKTSIKTIKVDLDFVITETKEIFGNLL